MSKESAAAKKKEDLPTVILFFKRDPAEKTTDWEWKQCADVAEAQEFAKTNRIVSSYIITGFDLQVVGV